MTKDENKASYSEIVPRHLPYSWGELMNFNFQLQYAILKGGNALIHRSTVDGFAHIIMVEGIWSGTYLLNGRSHIIQCCENAIHPVRKNCLFEWKNVSEDIVAILLFIPQVMLDELITIKYGYDVSKLDSGLISKNNQRLSLVVSRLYDLSVQQRFLNTLRLQILLMETLLYQIEGFHFEKEQPEFGNNKNYYEKVHQVKMIIEYDLSKNYTISELAKEVGTNEQYIKKYFKQYFGKTVMNYATNIKMEHAKKLILTGEYRIADVARMIGYKHPSHFTTAFKKYFGFTPNSLR